MPRQRMKEDNMNDFWKNLAALIKVKTIVTLVVIGVFAALALSGAIPSDTTMAVVTMVVAFYFGTQSKKEQRVHIGHVIA